MTFRTPDEAVALANNTPYGLAASVWTRTSISRSTWPEDQGRHRLGQFAPTCSMPPPASAAIARAGSAARAARKGMYEYLPAARDERRRQRSRGRRFRRRRARRRRPRRRAGHRSHAEDVHRRQAGPARLGLLAARCSDAAGAVIGEVGRRQPQRHPQCRRGGACGAPAWGKRHGAQPRTDPVLHRREPGGAEGEFAAPSRVDDGAGRRGRGTR